jgi:filamentous hemagglutinin family protein
MSPTKNASPNSRNRLLATCAAAAVATMTVGMPVRAQTLAPGGFQGSHVVVNDTADVTQFGTNTLVTDQGPRAIINWTPGGNFTTEGQYDFLPTGRSADFVNASNRSGQDYIVLNRIIAADQSRAIALNGLVRSTLGTSNTSSQGGQVWFYAPSGLLVGSTAQINVGSLLLTANNIADSDFLDGNSGFSFGRENSNASVVIANGAQISAISRDSYVAVVAPRIVQAGNVTVNGSAAYVAAEQVDMTISGSMFDIAVSGRLQRGRAGRRHIDHSGQTTLTNSIAENGYGSGAQGPRDAIMVAVPKNDAVTMLVSGGIAYQQATGANVVNGRIILSGGHDVSSETISGPIGGAAPAAAGASIAIGSGVFGAANSLIGRQAMTLEAQATGTASIGTPASSVFGGNVTLRGKQGASVVATGINQQIDFEGDLLVDASGAEDGGGQKATVAARADAVITVGGRLDVLANANGSASFASSRTAEIALQNRGVLQVVGDVTVRADAGADTRIGRDAVSTVAGTARISLANAGDALQGELVTVTARATGRNGGSGTGGNASVTSSAGGLDVADLTVSTEGIGGLGLSGGADRNRIWAGRGRRRCAGRPRPDRTGRQQQPQPGDRDHQGDRGRRRQQPARCRFGGGRRSGRRCGGRQRDPQLRRGHDPFKSGCAGHRPRRQWRRVRLWRWRRGRQRDRRQYLAGTAGQRDGGFAPHQHERDWRRRWPGRHHAG